MFELSAKSAVLMEAKTGTIIVSKDANIPLSPASVTKIMTLLLVMEAIENEKISWDDSVTVSKYAASMGGSQVFLEEGESFSVEELIKCTVISSANDAAVALAEYISGSETAFVSEMNQKAAELGLTSSHFENVSGLDDDVENHVMSALDVATITKLLLKYPKLFTFSSTWQDTIRDGAFTLTNTNRLVRFYDGCTGLKTGSTDKAGYCITVTAERNDMTLICVIMGADTKDERNREVRELLDYGFSHYELFSVLQERLEQVPVYGAMEEKIDIYNEAFVTLVAKGKSKDVKITYELPSYLSAPLIAGNEVGMMKYYLDGEEIGSSRVYIQQDCEKASYFLFFKKIISDVFLKKEKTIR